MKDKFPLLILIVLLAQISLSAQNKYSLAQFGDESVRFIQQPAKWESNDWVKLCLAGGGTILSMIVDQPVRDQILKDRSYYKSFPIEAGRMWGEGYPTAIFAGAFGFHGIIANDPSTKKIAFEIIQTAIYAGAITTFLKVAIGRARPFTDRGSSTIRPISFFDDDFHSLPSGHVTLAFSLSTVLAKNTGSDLLKILAYIPAVLTAVSRVYQDNHWTSDVILGASIGYFVGDWVTRQHVDKESRIQTSSIFPLSVRITLF
ncbi:MAG: hypothetical protein CVV24_07570 [Ignavibacteriae bacterium HGW-Ignavibacteriae-3]|nr:MAG: hypothetical protein CVV24_07570 [Ignavibacteriae bacterium HGW-Ignavibacteriae-3]